MGIPTDFFLETLSHPYDDETNYLEENIITGIGLILLLPLFMSNYLTLHYLLKLLDKEDYEYFIGTEGHGPRANSAHVWSFNPSI